MHWRDFVSLKHSFSKHFACFHTVEAHKLLAIEAVVDLSALLLACTRADLISFAIASNGKKTFSFAFFQGCKVVPYTWGMDTALDFVSSVYVFAGDDDWPQENNY